MYKLLMKQRIIGLVIGLIKLFIYVFIYLQRNEQKHKHKNTKEVSQTFTRGKKKSRILGSNRYSISMNHRLKNRLSAE